MTKRYGLSKEQKAKIQPLLLEQQKQVHTLGEDESLTDAEWAAAVRKVHQATVLKVRKQLTDAQLRQVCAGRGEAGEAVGERRGRGRRWASGWASTGWRASTGRRVVGLVAVGRAVVGHRTNRG